MFSRVSLLESFQHVASTDQRVRLLRYGEVTPTDVWINALAAGGPHRPHPLDGYSALWGELARMVEAKLLAGDWLAEGFTSENGSEPVPLPAALWRTVKLDLLEEGAVGGGYKYINLLITDIRKLPAGPLSQIPQYVATPSEAAELADLRPTAGRPRVLVVGGPGSPHDRRCARFDELEATLWARVLPRLTAGEWIARGFLKGDPQPRDISPELWSSLKCSFWNDEVYAQGSELHFHHVTVREAQGRTQATKKSTPGAQRRAVADFLRKEVGDGGKRKLRSELYEKAKAEVSPHLTGNMFDETLADLRRSGEVPDAAFYRGRPPGKAPEK